MKITKGIRILDKQGRIVSVDMPDILMEVDNGDYFYWSILSIDGNGYLRIDQEFLDLIENIRNSPNGVVVTWEELNMFSKSFEQIIDSIIIGCKDKSLLHRYEEDQEMYETCDFVINMFDSSFWEVFSKDDQFINKLTSKFKDIELLESDFNS